MTYEWARWILPALEADPVVAKKIILISGWEQKGRPPSQFSFFPSGIVEHHTACMANVGHDPQSCINGILNGNADAPGPIAQLLVTLTKPGVKWGGENIDPHAIVIAAGRCNHAGTGIYPWGAPSGNGSSIGIEVCGPPIYWPLELLQFRARVTSALLRNRLWGVHQVTTHWEYGRPVGRKIDPSGPTMLQPRLGRTDPWNPETWRRYIDETLAATRPPDPIKPPIIPPTIPPVELEEQELNGILYIIEPAFPATTANTEWLVKYADGHIERALGSTIAYAQAAKIPIIRETSAEHYQYQVNRRSAIPMI
jgi:hypothetical protein